MRVLQWVASAEVSRRGFSTTVRTWSGDIGKTPSRALDGARMDIEASGDGVVRAAFLGAQQEAGWVSVRAGATPLRSIAFRLARWSAVRLTRYCFFIASSVIGETLAAHKNSTNPLWSRTRYGGMGVVPMIVSFLLIIVPSHRGAATALPALSHGRFSPDIREPIAPPRSEQGRLRRSMSLVQNPVFRLSVTATANSRVVSSPAGIDCVSNLSVKGQCSALFASGTRVELTAIPGGAGKFWSWRGACSGTRGPRCVLTLDADKTVSVAGAAP